MSSYRNKQGSAAPAATAPTISSGTSAPNTTPGKVGDIFIDTSGKKMYIATGAASSDDWTLTN